MTSSSFIGSSLRDTLQFICSGASELTLVQIILLVSKIEPATKSRVTEVTVLAGNVTDVQNGGDSMLSATLREGLTEYAIGEKLRALRLRKKMGLVELGGHTGLSP